MNSTVPYMRCQPTYEELKQSSSTSNALSWLGCQPTYEELETVIYGVMGEGYMVMLAYL